MAMRGLGVLIRDLFGNGESARIAQSAIGKTIASLTLDTDADTDMLRFEFTDGSNMQLSDKGQSCCEQRYMRTDDDLAEFVGAVLINLELKDAPNITDDSGDHDVQFLVVTTSKGVFTMSNHNEHNGYYGGFSLEASTEQ
jgi:hypothetical protein